MNTKNSVLLGALAFVAAACGDISSPTTSSLSSVSSRSSLAAPSGYTVIANAAVTCTDGTIVGSVATNQAPPTGSVTLTNCPVTGTVTVGAPQVYDAFLSAYAALAPSPSDHCTVLTGTLDGVTLAPGTYCFDAAAALTGTLTLQGPSNASWAFQIGTSGTGALTGTNFSVVMDGGQPCNVTWWVAQAATMTDSHFVGTILAGAAITLTRGTFDGNAWATADVTVTGTTVTGCDPVRGGGTGPDKDKCNQGVGNGPEGCDPGNSNNRRSSNDEKGGIPGAPGRQGKP